MVEITDEFMNDMRAKAKNYTVAILKKGPNYQQDSEKKIIFEHGRRNYQLRADGVLSIVCPILDNGDFAGIGVFNCSVDEASKILQDDPAIKAGILSYSVHPSRSFPGDSLPG
ncbi:MAG TPA: YciI family protein [Candidatus Saccharimonadales bacterium]|nr:YciI family protein [Candidatus Saccharimonadales bacterium]